MFWRKNNSTNAAAANTNTVDDITTEDDNNTEDDAADFNAQLQQHPQVLLKSSNLCAAMTYSIS